MKIEVWSDMVCPFCYIGKRRLEAALDNFKGKDSVIVEFRSFELDPSAKKNTGKSIHEGLASKYGMPVEKAKQMNDQVAEQAKQVGLDYQFDKVIPTNTTDAHRLSHYAKTQGKMNLLTERLMKAYFTEGLDIGDHDTLVSLADDIGLDKEEAAKILDGDGYLDEVRLDQQKGVEAGVRGVPFFLFDGKYAVSGAQPVEAFTEALGKAAKS
ncbi:DsbA family oxidoreductase [Alteribacillus iranensis]|uniref:Predicted dithiol-disulfide isomerase, DsbA family n=1 Tax=Alteribacillus iranensis TaxID=930128 RepID=A0A1I2E5R0_9BACI|nr:DsbA family oxidoreductase [Alteribacillus iranensis]SFE87838.1 Predicted dithiol-disulfide isomerase, DsbA family [Alteribacillus iranensis]